MKQVIFICTGNICRSAMAEGYLKYKLKKMNIQDVIVTSAGIHTMNGESATSFAIEAIKRYKVDISNHKSTTIECSNIDKADYIIVMTNRHKKEILSRYIDCENRVHLLKEYLDSADYIDIDDPWGLSLDVYNDCAKEIVVCIDSFVEKELLKKGD